MAGRIKQLIEAVIEIRTNGKLELHHFVRAHLFMKGINPDLYDENSTDDPGIIETLERMRDDFSAQRKAKKKPNRDAKAPIE
jgi:hypothetical protein